MLRLAVIKSQFARAATAFLRDVVLMFSDWAEIFSVCLSIQVRKFCKISIFFFEVKWGKTALENVVSKNVQILKSAITPARLDGFF